MSPILEGDAEDRMEKDLSPKCMTLSMSYAGGVLNRYTTAIEFP